MRRLLPLFACLMLLLSCLSAMAHVAEEAGGRVAGIELAFHAPGDGDEVPADKDNGMPHHHNICHGHDVGTPQMLASGSHFVRMAALIGTKSAPALRPAQQAVALRPPQA